MKISRTVSEKRTYKNIDGMFISVEHSAFREMELPEGADPEKESFKLLLELKKEVLVAHLVDGTITQEQCQEALTNYENLVSSLQ